MNDLDDAALGDYTASAEELAEIEQYEAERDGQYVRVGVRFDDTPTVYTYLAPPPVTVGSLVVIPPSARCAMPQTQTVITLDPPNGYGGPLKRVLAVLS